MEYQGRPKAIEDFQKAMFTAEAWFVEATKNMTEAIAAGNLTRWTQEELDGVKSMLQESEKWATEQMAAQKKVGEQMHVDPVLLNADLERRGKALQSHVSCSACIQKAVTDTRVTGTWSSEETVAQATKDQGIVDVCVI